MTTIYFSGELKPWKTVHLEPEGIPSSEIHKAEVPAEDLSIGSTGRLFPFDGELPKHTVLLYINRRYVKMFGSLH